MFFVYMLANRKNGALYIGHTDDLGARVWQHKNKVMSGFASRYGCDRLVWYEVHDSRESAFARERQMKQWNRSWKLRRIEAKNPQWHDLYDGLTVDDVYHPERLYDAGKL